MSVFARVPKDMYHSTSTPLQQGPLKLVLALATFMVCIILLEPVVGMYNDRLHIICKKLLCTEICTLPD